MIDLESLKQAMSDITRVGHVEHTYEIDGKRMVMWPLNTQAEREVFEQAQHSTAGQQVGDEADHSAGIAYMDNFRIAALARSIVVVGDIDLREEEFVMTGTTLKGGQHQKIKRSQALQDIIEKWSKPLIEQNFLQFTELQRKVEDKAQAAVKFIPSDLSSEIDRLSERLEWLQDQLKRQDRPDPEQSKKIKDQISTLNEMSVRNKRNLLGDEVTQDEQTEPVTGVVTARPQAPQAFSDVAQSNTAPPAPEKPPEKTQDPQPPRTVAAPMPRSERPEAPKQPSQPVAEPQDFEKHFREQNPDLPPQEPVERYTSTGDSMMGEDMMASVEAESLRQQHLRKQRIEQDLEKQRQEEIQLHETRETQPSGPSRVPPHLQARNVADEVAGDSISQAVPLGTVQGIQAYKLPKTELSERTRASEKKLGNQKAVVNPQASGSQNPRFVGRKKL